MVPSDSARASAWQRANPGCAWPQTALWLCGWTAASASSSAEAARLPNGDPTSPFPHCFVCGRDRRDGLRLFAGPMPGRDLVAAPWVPSAPSRALVWAALDCPGAFAVDPGLSRGATVLGRLAVHVQELPREGDELVVVAWDLGGAEGRRSYAGTALFRGETALAWGRATWFSIPSGA